MKESLYYEILDACGGSYDPLPAGELKALQQAWREVYSASLFAATGRWKLGPYEWHTFSFEHAKARNGDRALLDYAAQAPETVVISPEAVRLPAVRLNPGRLPSFEGHFVDIYVYPESLDWTMAFTHEASLGLGPYFSRREWMKSPDEPQHGPPRRRSEGG